MIAPPARGPVVDVGAMQRIADDLWAKRSALWMITFGERTLEFWALAQFDHPAEGGGWVHARDTATLTTLMDECERRYVPPNRRTVPA
jgi:hypothetical protein